MERAVKFSPYFVRTSKETYEDTLEASKSVSLIIGTIYKNQIEEMFRELYDINLKFGEVWPEVGAD